MSTRALKPIVFALSLAPAAWLFFAAATDALGPNPAEALIRSTGDWALRFLCVTLAVTLQWSASRHCSRGRARPRPMLKEALVCPSQLPWRWLPPSGLAIGSAV